MACGCDICGELPASLVVNTGRDERFPDAVRKLLSLRTNPNAVPSDYDIWRCPACDALFEWEDRRQFYGSGNLDEEELTRVPDAPGELSPVRAARILALLNADTGSTDAFARQLAERCAQIVAKAAAPPEPKSETTPTRSTTRSSD